ncbi:hypothetical protein B296_00042893 [Ensete ventricosum]|uniref:Uncharacterized protein n=1 Tax=Ensete ventricosum TaxID=4639 RepID=A0A426YEZ7_ENSVE|nr:hypothetical protein B296_00042893 [Ensete ventricosum]
MSTKSLGLRVEADWSGQCGAWSGVVRAVGLPRWTCNLRVDVSRLISRDNVATNVVLDPVWSVEGPSGAAEAVDPRAQVVGLDRLNSCSCFAYMFNLMKVKKLAGHAASRLIPLPTTEVPVKAIGECPAHGGKKHLDGGGSAPPRKKTKIKVSKTLRRVAHEGTSKKAHRRKGKRANGGDEIP